MSMFPLCSPTVVCCKCVFRQQKLATYHKGKREQTLNICSPSHTVLRLWAIYFPLCLEGGRGGGSHIERCLTLEVAGGKVSHGPHIEIVSKETVDNLTCERLDCVSNLSHVRLLNHSPISRGCVATLPSVWVSFCLGPCLKDSWFSRDCLFLRHTLW